MVGMANNLSEMISLAGMTSRAVATEKGVTPETVSRHAHNHVQMTVSDIEDYAKILGCSPQEIAFTTPPIPIIGVIISNEDNKTVRIDSHFRSHPQYKKKGYYVKGYYEQNTACIQYDFSADYRGTYKYLSNAIEMVSIQGIIDNEVDKECIMNSCYAMTTDGILTSGILYPQPENRFYTLTRPSGAFREDIVRDLDLAWAVPCLSIITRPKLRGAELVDFESPLIEKYYDRIAPKMTADEKLSDKKNKAK